MEDRGARGVAEQDDGLGEQAHGQEPLLVERDDCEVVARQAVELARGVLAAAEPCVHVRNGAAE